MAALARNAQRIHGNSTVKACDVQKTNAAKGTAIRNTTEAQGKSRRRARIGPVSYTHLIEHGDAEQTIANFTKAVERFANMK